jgi:hypothetical protein
MGSRHPERTHVFNQLHDSKFAIEKNNIDRKPHPESVNAIARPEPDRLLRGETAAKHQPAKPLEKCIRQHDLL